MSGETIPRNQRVYVVIEAMAGGLARMRLSLMPPAYQDALAVLIARGAIPSGSDASLPLVSDSAAVKAEQIATLAIAETASVAITAGLRTVTLTKVAGVKKADPVLLLPAAALPAGYAILNAVATADNTVVATLIVPALAIGAKYSLPCRLVRLNI